MIYMFQIAKTNIFILQRVLENYAFLIKYAQLYMLNLIYYGTPIRLRLFKINSTHLIFRYIKMTNDSPIICQYVYDYETNKPSVDYLDICWKTTIHAQGIYHTTSLKNKCQIQAFLFFYYYGNIDIVYCRTSFILY